MGQAQPKLTSPPDDEPLDGGRMGFLDHLDEARKRIIRSCIAVAIGMGVAAMFIERIGDFILAPTLRVLPPGTQLVYIHPGDGFSFYFDLVLIGGSVLAAPFVAYQVWRFIAPGLYAREKRFAIPFVLLTTLGVVGGALFSHYVMFPGMIAFFGTFSSPRMKFMPGVDETFSLYKTLLLGMVVVFQIPTLAFFLAKMGVVTARFLWGHIRYAILAIFVVAAVVTPSTDPWNQFVFAGPMIVLYLMSIGIAWLAAPKRDKASGRGSDSGALRLVVGAMVLNQSLKIGKKRCE
jgi:sec-independent protein translocase protein TatC